MVFMNSTTIYTVDAKKFELVFTIKSDEIVMNQALLGNLILVANSVELKAGTEIVLSTLKRFNVFSMVLLQKDGGFRGRALITHRRVSVWRIWQGATFFTV